MPDAKCTVCGAPLSRRETTCSYCGRANEQHEPAGPRVQGLLARGLQAVRDGRYADAVEPLAQVIESDREVFDAYFHLAAAWHGLGQTQRALEAMRQAGTIRPGSASLHLNIGVLERALGHGEAARGALDEALRLAASDPLLSDRADFLSRVRKEMESLDASK